MRFTFVLFLLSLMSCRTSNDSNSSQALLAKDTQTKSASSYTLPLISPLAVVENIEGQQVDLNLIFKKTGDDPIFGFSQCFETKFDLVPLLGKALHFNGIKDAINSDKVALLVTTKENNLPVIDVIVDGIHADTVDGQKTLIFFVAEWGTDGKTLIEKCPDQ